MGRVLLSVIKRDLTLYQRRLSTSLMPLLFFVMVISFFAIGLGAEHALLSRIAPVIIWVAVVLALFMSMEILLKEDYKNGSLAQFIVSPYPLSLLLLSKNIAHFLAIGLPFCLIAPLFLFLLQGSTQSMGVLGITLLLGIPTLSLLASIGAAITLGLANSSLLLIVLMLPFMIPIVIFAISAVVAVDFQMPFDTPLLLLSAIALLVMVLGPVVLSHVLKISVGEG